MFLEDRGEGGKLEKGWAASQGRFGLGRRDVGRKMGRFKAGDRDCLYAITHLEEKGMGKPALDSVFVRSGIGGREWRAAGSGQDEDKRSFHERKGRARFCSFGAVWECAKHAYALGYSDFHNLMGFTSKKMPNNIL